MLSSTQALAKKLNVIIIQKTKRFLAVAGVASLGLGLSAQAYASCLQGIESGTYAKSVRTLQSDMMVAALSCNERALYNSFSTNYRTDLVRHGKALRAHFKATNGGQGVKKLNAYVTELANDASVRHARTGSQYCKAARQVFLQLLGDQDNPVELSNYALRYAIAVRPQLAQEISVAAGGDGSCDSVASLNLTTAAE